MNPLALGPVTEAASITADAPAAKPALTIATLDGKSFDLAAQKGNWVIVNFWATWCSPCIKELPEISKFVADHKNVRAVGLAYEDTDKAEIEAFLKKHPVSYPIAQVDVFDPPKAFYFVIEEYNEVLELCFAMALFLFMLYQLRALARARPAPPAGA